MVTRSCRFEPKRCTSAPAVTPASAAISARVSCPGPTRDMTRSAAAQASFAVSGHDRATYDRNVARGYTPAGLAYSDRIPYFGTAAGLTASVVDVARFSLALDGDVLLSPATKALAFTPTLGTAGDTLPYALGWFATRYRGVRVVWHYGLWTAISSLIIKVPERGLTFVLLANTDGLSSPYPLGQGKLESSPWARAFLDAFVFGEPRLPP